MLLCIKQNRAGRTNGVLPRNMQVSVLGPKGEIWKGKMKQVNLPTEDGEVSVLDFHQPFLMRLKHGLVRLPDKRAVIKDGIAFMRGNELTLFVET
jgi:F0F1-type ATP synthase epsilon subunit